MLAHAMDCKGSVSLPLDVAPFITRTVTVVLQVKLPKMGHLKITVMLPSGLQKRAKIGQENRYSHSHSV